MIEITQLPAVPVRPANGHKGTFGHVVVVAGSLGMSGAACLAGVAALRSGAGLVTLAVPASVQPVVAGYEPGYLCKGLADDDGKFSIAALPELFELCDRASAVAIGPGLGQSDELAEIVTQLTRRLSVPMVLDADALNLIALRNAAAVFGEESRGADNESRVTINDGGPQSANRVPSAQPAHGLAILSNRPAAHNPSQTPANGVRVITPHPGEFARLCGCSVADVQSNRLERAGLYARQHGVLVLLKGQRSILTDGSQYAVNNTGNSGLAKGGSGDVLTGLLAGLLATGLPAFEAAHLAMHVHGLAGDLAAAELTEQGMMASDLPRFLPMAWKGLAGL